MLIPWNTILVTKTSSHFSISVICFYSLPNSFLFIKIRGVAFCFILFNLWKLSFLLRLIARGKMDAYSSSSSSHVQICFTWYIFSSLLFDFLIHWINWLHKHFNFQLQLLLWFFWTLSCDDLFVKLKFPEYIVPLPIPTTIPISH